jgi:hypothetical protein
MSPIRSPAIPSPITYYTDSDLQIALPVRMPNILTSQSDQILSPVRSPNTASQTAYCRQSDRLKSPVRPLLSPIRYHKNSHQSGKRSLPIRSPNIASQMSNIGRSIISHPQHESLVIPSPISKLPCRRLAFPFRSPIMPRPLS